MSIVFNGKKVMKIYLSHATNFDYQNELYEPIKQSTLWQQHQVILPHEQSSLPTDSREIIKNCDVVLAEVSYPSTGVGVELAWANDAKRRIVCIYKKSVKFSSALRIVCEEFVQYEDIRILFAKNFF